MNILYKNDDKKICNSEKINIHTNHKIMMKIKVVPTRIQLNKIEIIPKDSKNLPSSFQKIFTLY